MITLYEYNGMNEKLTADLRQLIDCCRAVDHYEPIIYWEVLHNTRSMPGDYVLYQENSMVGYLSSFYFEEDKIEISFAIHPDFRNQSLFEDLLEYALQAVQTIHYDSILISIHDKDRPLQGSLSRLGAQSVYKEYNLIRTLTTPEIIDEAAAIELLRASDSAAAEQLGKIHHDCFNSDLELMTLRFSNTLEMPNRRSYFAMHQGEIIGALHSRVDNTGALFLHDISINPEKRGRGFGLALIRLAINLFMNEGQTVFNLTVASNQSRALSLYQRCHFEIQDIYQFWALDKKFTFPPHYSLPPKRH